MGRMVGELRCPTAGHTVSVRACTPLPPYMVINGITLTEMCKLVDTANISLGLRPEQ